MDLHRNVHTDGTRVDSGVRPQTRSQVLLIFTKKNGQRVRVLADKDRFTGFLQGEVERLQTERERLAESAQKVLEGSAGSVFDRMRGRVPGFSEWYFGWRTTYQMLGLALWTAVSRAAAPRVMDLDDTVKHALKEYIDDHYEALVLRPELTDPALRLAYTEALSSLRRRFLDVIAEFDSKFQAFVASHTTYLDRWNPGSRVELRLDWDSQIKKLSVAGFQHKPLSSIAGMALVTSGAIAGRAGGAAAGKLLAGRAGHAAAGAVAGRLASPYAGRALGMLTAASVGASAGPAGAVIGGAAGLGVDYLLHEVVALRHREALEAAVKEILDMQERQWCGAMGRSLEAAVNVWFDDLTALLVQHAS